MGDTNFSTDFNIQNSADCVVFVFSQIQIRDSDILKKLKVFYNRAKTNKKEVVIIITMIDKIDNLGEEIYKLDTNKAITCILYDKTFTKIQNDIQKELDDYDVGIFPVINNDYKNKIKVDLNSELSKILMSTIVETLDKKYGGNEVDKNWKSFDIFEDEKIFNIKPFKF
jgi:hypothetical protein